MTCPFPFGSYSSSLLPRPATFTSSGAPQDCYLAHAPPLCSQTLLSLWPSRRTKFLLNLGPNCPFFQASHPFNISCKA